MATAFCRKADKIAKGQLAQWKMTIKEAVWGELSSSVWGIKGVAP
jgi:hypothetical protein